MIVINKDNLIEKIRNHGFKVASFYDGIFTNIDQEKRPYFEKYKEDSVEGLIGRIENFAKTYPGQFTVILKHGEGSHHPAMVFVRFDQVINPQSGQTQLNGAGFQFETPQQMEDRLLNKIKNQMRENMLEHENKALKAKLQGLETTGGKLANMLEMWLEAKFLGKKIPALQGTPDKKAGAKKPAQKNEDPDEDEINEEDLKQAMGKILDLLGADTIIKLAEKLDSVGEDDPIINMIINYANN